jgi:hypothetical protein
MKDDPKGHTKQKKPYIKPEVTQVQLKPEEAVLGLGCKVSGSGTGPDGPCTILMCINNGS